MIDKADEKVPLEIERKYLIRFPDISVLCKQDGYSLSDISQLYLESNKEHCTMRIRKRCTDSSCKYILTYKKHITGMVREEYEEEISEDEYKRLKLNRKNGFSEIEKKRICFLYSGKLFELDIFPFWSDRAFLEIELTSENEEFQLPPFIQIIKEVTDDSRYTNYSLAQRIITEAV